MNRVLRLCLGLSLLGASGAALAQSKPPNIHFIVDTSGSMRELPQVINSGHEAFFNMTTNGCSNARLDAVSSSGTWNAAASQPLPDPGTGVGGDVGFPNLFQDSKFYGYMTWGDSSAPEPQWNTKEEACQSQVPGWDTTNTAEYNLCLSCLGTKGYFKQQAAEGDDFLPANFDFILWGRFLNFNPPRYVPVRAAIKQVLEQVTNARVGYSYLLTSAPSSKMGQRQSATCSESLADANAFESHRGTFIAGINALTMQTASTVTRALFNAGYHFTSGDEVYRDVFGFGTGYSYPADFTNAALTSDTRSWCWGDQASAVIIISEGEPTSDGLSATVVTKLRTLNGGPVYCPDSAPCGALSGSRRDKGTNPAPTYTADDNPNYYLDDVAKLLAQQDLQRANPPVVGDFDTSGQQSLRIHTIGYGGQNNLLRNTAAVGNGLYFTATDVPTLQSALQSILCTMGAKTDACPAVP